ncbi:3103_t:CDS:2 [Rhizophagus irregularis]|nr:3103_t:CDS:2 [Rhizophagus irregularis]
MVSISSIPATSSSTTTSSRTTMPSQLQQHHDNGVRNDINVVSNQSNNSIMGNTNVKNTHNNRQFLFNNHDPQNQQHHTDSSRINQISSLLCVPYDSPSSEDSMDDESSHLGDTESLGSPNKNLLTPNSSPPFSPPEMTATVDREKQRLEDTPWKRPRIINQDDNSKPLVLPSIRSFTSVPDLRIDSENLNGQFINSHHQPSSSLPSTPLSDHGKINSPADHHSPQKTWNNLEQFAAITEACRTSSNTNSSHSSHADIMDNSNIRLPPASSLTNNNHSFDNNNNSSVQQQSSQQSLLLRRSSFEIPQTTRYSPYTPSTLNPYMSSRLLSDQRRHSDLSGYTTSISTSPRNDHSENSYLHHNNNHHHHHNNPSSSPYGYDNRDRHYVQRSHYGGMHSPPSPNTYAVPHHGGYSMSSHNSHHHLQMSHHHHHHHLGSPYMDPTNSATMVKAKRKRANASQLKVLNQVFQHTFFPSTELRIQLGKQLGMSPRTVQIWFQNKRQSWRSKPSNSSLSCSDDDEMGRRTVPDSPTSPTESGYAHYYHNHHRSNSVSTGGSGGNMTGSLQHHNNSSVITTSSSLPPPSSLTNQLPSPAYSTTSSVGNNERLPSISSFSHSNNYDPFTSSRLPAPIMINHRSQAQSSFNC